MKKVIAFVLMISFTLTSCTHTILKSDVEKDDDFYKLINKRCEGKKEIMIKKLDGVLLKARDVVIDKDTTYYHTLDSGQLLSVSTKEIRNLSYNKNLNGIIEGVGLGAIGSFVLGLFAYLILSSSSTEAGVSPLIYLTLSPLIGGTIYGILNPSQYIIEIN